MQYSLEDTLGLDDFQYSFDEEFDYLDYLADVFSGGPAAPSPAEVFRTSPTLAEEMYQRAIDQLTGAVAARWPELPEHEIQTQFRACQKLFRGFCGGRGAGKSTIGVKDLMERAKSGRLYMVVGPSYRTLADSTVRSFMEIGNKLGCVQSFHKTDFCATIATRDGGTAQVNFRSADKPETLRGPNLSGTLCDEASLYNEEAIKIIIACLREAGEMGWLSMTFTPKGKGHWTYDWFFDKKGNPKPNTALFRATTKQNPFLPPQFYDIIKEKYVPGSTLARQELEGEFVDLSGLMFQWAWFKRVEIVPAGGIRVRYWDKAGTEGGGDYSAGVLLCRAPDGIWYVEDIVRGQWSPRRRNEIIRAVAQRDAERYDNQVTIWVEQEPGSGGKESAILTVQDLAAYPVYVERVSGEKVIRSRPFQAQCEAGNVRIRDARWTEEFLDELCGFPESKHDDQVDAVCGAYNKIAMGMGLDYSGDLIAYPSAQPKPGEELPSDPADLMEYLQQYAGLSDANGKTPRKSSRKSARDRLMAAINGR